MASNNQNQYKHCFKKILITHTHKKIEEKVKKEAFLENPLTHKKYMFHFFTFFYCVCFPQGMGTKKVQSLFPRLWTLFCTFPLPICINNRNSNTDFLVEVEVQPLNPQNNVSNKD